MAPPAEQQCGSLNHDITMSQPQQAMPLNRRTLLRSAAAVAAPTIVGLPLVSQAATKSYTYGGSAWLGHYSAYIAIKAGIFASKGLDIKWQSFPTSSDRMGAVMAGSIDLAGTGVVSSLALMAAGATQFKLIATPNNFGRAEGVLVRQNVSDITQLKGKKIGVTFASSAHVLILDLLKQAGLRPDTDVALINLPAPNLLSAYQGNQIDAAVAWTPAFDRIKTLPNTRVLADDTAFSLYKDFNITPGPDVLLASARLVKNDSAAIKVFMQGIFEANAMLRDKPEEAARLLLELTGLTQEEQLNTIRQTGWYDATQQRELLVQPGSFVTGMQKLAEMLVSLKQIDKAPTVRNWLDGSFV
jgi:taurine transport system substrate-binding protein